MRWKKVTRDHQTIGMCGASQPLQCFRPAILVVHAWLSGFFSRLLKDSGLDQVPEEGGAQIERLQQFNPGEADAMHAVCPDHPAAAVARLRGGRLMQVKPENQTLDIPGRNLAEAKTGSRAADVPDIRLESDCSTAILLI